MLTRLFDSVTGALDLNVATLSGCVDIIVVPQHDGTLKSTPFHVRFGKTKLIRSREKEVAIIVNGIPTDLKMKLGGAGEAYFSELHEEGEVVFKGRDDETSRTRNDEAPQDAAWMIPDNEEIRPDVVAPTNGEGVGSSTTAAVVDPGAQLHTEIPLPYPHAPVRPPQINRPEECPSIFKMVDPEGYYNEKKDTSPIEFSLCGHLLTGGRLDEMRDNDAFVANMMSWEDLNSEPTFWYHPSLVCRFDYQPPYYPGKVALPLVASWVAFNRPLSLSSVTTLLKTEFTAAPLTEKSFISRMFGHSDTQESLLEETKRPPPLPTICGSTCGLVRTRRVLRPTSDQLKSFNLKCGCNTIEFVVTSSLQGTQTVKGFIYLWGAQSKIVISDVDGTITKSDVLGHLFPVIGRDWSHEGVAALYSKCIHNNYKIIYLTARAIGQADPTRDYLFGLRQQEGAQLPDGPLIMSPDRLFDSFKREVIDRKPYVFKIQALRDIRSLFPRDYNPFYAGFGNRDTDHRSYVHIGCPESRVFIIDPAGKIYHVNKTYAHSYSTMSEMAEQIFPAIPDDLGHMGYQIPLVEEDQVRRSKRITPPDKYYESWTAERSNLKLALEDGQEVHQGSGMCNCCSVQPPPSPSAVPQPIAAPSETLPFTDALQVSQPIAAPSETLPFTDALQVSQPIAAPSETLPFTDALQVSQPIAAPNETLPFTDARDLPQPISSNIDPLDNVLSIHNVALNAMLEVCS